MALAAGQGGDKDANSARLKEAFESCYTKCVAQETKDVAEERLKVIFTYLLLTDGALTTRPLQTLLHQMRKKPTHKSHILLVLAAYFMPPWVQQHAANTQAI